MTRTIAGVKHHNCIAPILFNVRGMSNYLLLAGRLGDIQYCKLGRVNLPLPRRSSHPRVSYIQGLDIKLSSILVRAVPWLLLAILKSMCLGGWQPEGFEVEKYWPPSEREQDRRTDVYYLPPYGYPVNPREWG